MKKVTKKLQKFIDSISYIGDSKIPDDDGKIYYSKVDDSYLTRVGMENDLNYLLKLGIIDQIQAKDVGGNTASIGYNPIEQKWYGWGHRAIYGFGIGSTCKKGDCGYNSDNKENFKEMCLNFWADEYSYTSGDEKAEFTKGLDWGSANEVDGVLVSYTYDGKVPNKTLRGTVYTYFSPFPEKWGKGEWTAKTLEDAKEMAKDFAEGVS